MTVMVLIRSCDPGGSRQGRESIRVLFDGIMLYWLSPLRAFPWHANLLKKQGMSLTPWPVWGRSVPWDKLSIVVLSYFRVCRAGLEHNERLSRRDPRTCAGLEIDLPASFPLCFYIHDHASYYRNGVV